MHCIYLTTTSPHDFSYSTTHNYVKYNYYVNMVNGGMFVTQNYTILIGESTWLSYIANECDIDTYMSNNI